MEALHQRLDAVKLDEAANMLKVIAHPLRMAIVDLLSQKKRLTVTEIFETLNIEQAVASHHLRIMKDRGVLNADRQGKNTFYYLRHERITQVIQCVEGCCADTA